MHKIQGLRLTNQGVEIVDVAREAEGMLTNS